MRLSSRKRICCFGSIGNQSLNPLARINPDTVSLTPYRLDVLNVFSIIHDVLLLLSCPFTFGSIAFLVKGLNHEEQKVKIWLENRKFPIPPVWAFWSIEQSEELYWNSVVYVSSRSAFLQVLVNVKCAFKNQCGIIRIWQE